MNSTAAFFARLIGLLAAAVATLAVALVVLGLPPAAAGRTDAAPEGATVATAAADAR